MLRCILLSAIAFSSVSIITWTSLLCADLHRHTGGGENVNASWDTPVSSLQQLQERRRSMDRYTQSTTHLYTSKDSLEYRIRTLETQLAMTLQNSKTTSSSRSTTYDTRDASQRGMDHTEDQRRMDYEWQLPSVLPNCRDLMRIPYSPLSNGDFLTNAAESEVVWRSRHDGSRELDLAHTCHLHRYTAFEAKQCLQGQHLNMIGDSVTRYQFLSLSYLIHHGTYPPHFPRSRSRSRMKTWNRSSHKKRTECRHINEYGIATCSPPDQPNLCAEEDWRHGRGKWDDSWHWLHHCIGDQNGIFNGYMECNCARRINMECTGIGFSGTNLCAVDNELYVSPPSSSSSDVHDNLPNERIILSYIQDYGWNKTNLLIKGYNWTNCAFDGSCTRSESMIQHSIKRAEVSDFDFMESLVHALGENGILRRQLPPANITIYNRGLWGVLSRKQSPQVMSGLYNYVDGQQGRCFYRSTTASSRSDSIQASENSYIRQDAFMAGCNYLDFAHITRAFVNLPFQAKGIPYRSKVSSPQRLSPYPNEVHVHNNSTSSVNGPFANGIEREAIFWDAVHFMPWVYEELNNLLLNVLCNAGDGMRHDAPGMENDYR